jgi:hypothetical protein
MKSAPQVLFGWRRGAAYAVLLGLAMGALEGAAPMAVLTAGAAALNAVSSLVGWIFGAAVIVAATAWAVPRSSMQALIPVTVCAVVAITALRVATPVPLIGPDGVEWRDGSIGPLVAGPWYLGWGLMLYSALFVGASALAFRADRTRGLLAQAEIARGRSEALFDEAALASLQGVIEPRFVLRVLGELQRRYAADAAAADRLLEQLVAFLRLAMPAVRSGSSTLGAELALVCSYMTLCVALDPQRAGWRCEADGALDDEPFPQLLLVPVLDALTAQAPSAARGLRITARSDGATVVLTVNAATPTGRLPDTLLHRMRIGLHALHGAAAHVGATAGVPLTISFSCAGKALPSTPQTPGGTHHGRTLKR